MQNICKILPKKEEKQIVEELKELAQKGELKAQLELADANYEGDFSVDICTGNGRVYCSDIFVFKDYKKAFYWYQKAFNQGSKEAATKLGEMYEQGKYVSKDLNKAKECYDNTLKFASTNGNI